MTIDDLHVNVLYVERLVLMTTIEVHIPAVLKWRTAVRVRTVERTNPDRPTLEHPSNIKHVLYKVSI